MTGKIEPDVEVKDPTPRMAMVREVIGEFHEHAKEMYGDKKELAHVIMLLADTVTRYRMRDGWDYKDGWPELTRCATCNREVSVEKVGKDGHSKANKKLRDRIAKLRGIILGVDRVIGEEVERGDSHDDYYDDDGDHHRT